MALSTSKPRYPEAPLTELDSCGFIYLGMRVDPPRRIPFVRGSAARDHSIAELKAVAQELENHHKVVTAQVYRAVLIPPTPGSPRFDVVMLIRTTTPQAITEVQDSAAYLRLHPALTITARNVMRIGDTDATRAGTFLFNHFTAPDRDNAPGVFPHLAGWYTAKIGVDNATLLQPLDPDAPYAVVNYVRIRSGPVRFLLDQFARPSFYRYVRHRLLRPNQLRAFPILVQPA